MDGLKKRVAALEVIQPPNDEISDAHREAIGRTVSAIMSIPEFQDPPTRYETRPGKTARYAVLAPGNYRGYVLWREWISRMASGSATPDDLRIFDPIAALWADVPASDGTAMDVVRLINRF